jgi:hypothetical protein
MWERQKESPSHDTRPFVLILIRPLDRSRRHASNEAATEGEGVHLFRSVASPAGFPIKARWGEGGPWGSV